MPQTLRKAPKRELQWVVNKETKKKYSKQPLPKESAKAQMRALQAVENRRLRGGIGSEEEEDSDPAAAEGVEPLEEIENPVEEEAGVQEVPEAAAEGPPMDEEGMREEGQEAFVNTLLDYIQMGMPDLTRDQIIDRVNEGGEAAMNQTIDTLLEPGNEEQIRWFQTRLLQLLVHRGYDFDQIQNIFLDAEEQGGWGRLLEPLMRGEHDEELGIAMAESLREEGEPTEVAEEEREPEEAEESEDPARGEGRQRTWREKVLKAQKLPDKSQSLAQLAKVTRVPKTILQEVQNRAVGAQKTQPKSVRLKNSQVKNVDAPMSAKLSKEQWGMARVQSFLGGNPNHDNDLRRNR